MTHVTVRQLIKDLDLEVLYFPEKEEVDIHITDVNRPGLQLAGFYKYFAYERVQILGKVEWTYFSTLAPQVRSRRSDEIFAHPIPCMVITRDLSVYEELLNSAKKFNRPLLRTSMSSTKFLSKITNYLEDKMAPSRTRHGV